MLQAQRLSLPTPLQMIAIRHDGDHKDGHKDGHKYHNDGHNEREFGHKAGHIERKFGREFGEFRVPVLEYGEVLVQHRGKGVYAPHEVATNVYRRFRWRVDHPLHRWGPNEPTERLRAAVDQCLRDLGDERAHLAALEPSYLTGDARIGGP